jgi:hypothetical protein
MKGDYAILMISNVVPVEKERISDAVSEPLLSFRDAFFSQLLFNDCF